MDTDNDKKLPNIKSTATASAAATANADTITIRQIKFNKTSCYFCNEWLENENIEVRRGWMQIVYKSLLALLNLLYRFT